MLVSSIPVLTRAFGASPCDVHVYVGKTYHCSGDLDLVGRFYTQHGLLVSPIPPTHRFIAIVILILKNTKILHHDHVRLILGEYRIIITPTTRAPGTTVANTGLKRTTRMVLDRTTHTLTLPRTSYADLPLRTSIVMRFPSSMGPCSAIAPTEVVMRRRSAVPISGCITSRPLKMTKSLTLYPASRNPVRLLLLWLRSWISVRGRNLISLMTFLDLIRNSSLSQVYHGGGR